MKRIVFSVMFSCLMASAQLFAQETFTENGIKDIRESVYAFRNATIFLSPGEVQENATLLIDKGIVVAVGKTVQIPKGVTVFDLKGHIIYPSFIDLHTDYGMPKKASATVENVFMQPEKIEPANKGAYNANEAIRTSHDAIEQFEINAENARSFRASGFGVVLTFMPDGIARGTSALVALTILKSTNRSLLVRAAAHFSFQKGSSGQSYPISLMGSNALLRQTHYDAQWYEKNKAVLFYDETLEAYNISRSMPQIFSTTDLQNLLRADALGDEIGKQFIIKGSGDEYQQINSVKATNAPLIIPVNFPTAPEISNAFEAMDVPLEIMKHWELAPLNLGMLAKNQVEFAISTTDLMDKTAFLPNLKKAIKNGLSEEGALKSLTVTPARIIGAEAKIGQLKPGYYANFIICTNSIFSDSAVINENWVLGQRYILNELDTTDLRGVYDLAIADTTYRIEISGKIGKEEFSIMKNDSVRIKMAASVERDFIKLSFSLVPQEGSIRLSGWKSGNNFTGSGQLADGTWVTWTATYSGPLKKTEIKKPEPPKKPDFNPHANSGPVIYPFIAHGSEKLPVPETILIVDATVWTNEKEGVLQHTDVLIRNGKIEKIGRNLNQPDARIISGTGKHLTAGIIDEHSHIALSSVNDIAVNSSMVRMKDVLMPDDINIYRQLAGGVTTSQLLHGSANPIGGQSAIIKLRWGRPANELLIQGADNYIKFALGENVTRAANPFSIRFPQSRMGVEQVYVDCFTRAREYDEVWKKYNNLSSKEKALTIPPRRELDLEPLVEILNGERFITCHSYVQSEINMLMKVAEQFGFKVNTFTHILEGYKVADKMKQHGSGASSFADWYNYKMEVVDAIPYNANILHSQGIITAINSDDPEMGRRLNQEAAKSVKYGGMSEEDALKMVTLNPAKLLHLDNRIGSIKIGKEADVVLWTDHPLSIYSFPRYTIIDGTVYFDLDEDQKNHVWIQQERARLIAKIKLAAESGEKTVPVLPNVPKHFHCDDILIDNH
ncbi:MAG: amidohydrolase family protein [Cyclobacteriaceae bacterium]|nr:amidohydrolase family protein [Cyclobacteriaceae bacterium]